MQRMADKTDWWSDVGKGVTIGLILSALGGIGVAAWGIIAGWLPKFLATDFRVVGWWFLGTYAAMLCLVLIAIICWLKSIGRVIRIRMVVKTNSDWYGLALSNAVELVEIIEQPNFLEGGKPEYKTYMAPIVDPEPLGVSKAFAWRMKKPTDDDSWVIIALAVAIRPIAARSAVSFHFGKGGLGKAFTTVYDCREREVFTHPSDNVNWNEPSLSVQIADLLPSKKKDNKKPD